MTRHAPNTSNPKAKALIESAQSRCAGCRENWPLRSRTFVHSGPRHLECAAQEERQQLRDMVQLNVAGLENQAAFARLKAAAHKRRVRYVVRYQWRRPEGLREGGDPNNWRDWRVFAAVPILFYSQDEAWDYTHMVGTFKNINGRKPSCSVERITLAT